MKLFKPTGPRDDRRNEQARNGEYTYGPSSYPHDTDDRPDNYPQFGPQSYSHGHGYGSGNALGTTAETGGFPRKESGDFRGYNGQTPEHFPSPAVPGFGPQPSGSHASGGADNKEPVPGYSPARRSGSGGNRNEYRGPAPAPGPGPGRPGSGYPPAPSGIKPQGGGPAARFAGNGTGAGGGGPRQQPGRKGPAVRISSRQPHRGGPTRAGEPPFFQPTQYPGLSPYFNPGQGGPPAFGAPPSFGGGPPSFGGGPPAFGGPPAPSGTPSSPDVPAAAGELIEAVKEPGSKSLFSLANLNEIKGFVDRLGGIDGILSTVTKFQKVFTSVQSMAPIVKMLMGAFGGSKAATTSTEEAPSTDTIEWRPKKKAKARPSKKLKRRRTTNPGKPLPNGVRRTGIRRRRY
ncbi:hypothetical protein ACFSL6_11915 [Paenibacillus thailandensis]|uniref:Uncharacterized protein n=1 Tax=Paenibacillus thailandensis TaxID=393250 RepID=A0ABW5QZ83_9BACL